MFDYPAFATLIRRKRGDLRLSQENLAAEALGDPGRKGDISKFENNKKKPQEKTIRARCDRLNISDAELDPIRQARPSAKQLDMIPSLSREELENLASRFEIEGVYDKSDSDLRQQLTYKAEEYRTLKFEVDNINEDMNRLANLKAAAQDAIVRLDLEEVENLLAMVQETELEEAAKTAELRANNALLRGKVDQAFHLLESAANSFGAISAEAKAERKILRYSATLGKHGQRYGGRGLRLAADLVAPELTDTLKSANAWLWAVGELNLATALKEQGIRSEGSAGTELLAQAVTAYRATLEVCTRAEHPVDWAITQNNLGTALKGQGIRAEGSAGAKLLTQAVTAYRAALEVYTRTAHPLDWAMTQNNLGTAMKNQSIRAEGSAGAELLAQAVTTYRAALKVRTRTKRPVAWAMTQNNLGNALALQGTRSGGSAGAELLAQAVIAWRAALEVRTRTEHPVDWAMTQQNIAIAMLEKSRHGTATDAPADLLAALQAVEAALTIFDPEHLSYNHTKANRLREIILAALSALDDQTPG